MANFDIIADFYDEIVLSRKIDNFYLKILTPKSQGKMLLDLGCGTGILTNKLSSFYDVTGVDISSKMLNYAKQLIPSGKFYCSDIVNFKTNEIYDVVICTYDVLNNVLNISDWVKLFNWIWNHLSENGIFAFDINTVKKMELMVEKSPIMEEINTDYSIINVECKDDYIYIWEHLYFQQITHDQFQLSKMTNTVRAYPSDQVMHALSQIFSSIKMYTIDDVQVENDNDNEDRLFAVCTK